MSPIFCLESNAILMISTTYNGQWHCPQHLSHFDISGFDRGPFLRRRRTVGASASTLIQSCSGVAVGSHVRWWGENCQRIHLQVGDMEVYTQYCLTGFACPFLVILKPYKNTLQKRKFFSDIHGGVSSYFYTSAKFPSFKFSCNLFCYSFTSYPWQTPY